MLKYYLDIKDNVTNDPHRHCCNGLIKIDRANIKINSSYMLFYWHLENKLNKLLKQK